MTKALTLTQPWAQAVAEGAKLVETRGWSTGYRGTLLIHAAKGWTAEDRRWAAALHQRGIIAAAPDQLALGFVIARATLADVVRVDAIAALTAQERLLGNYQPGRYAWILEDVRRLLYPTPARGALSLWEGPDWLDLGPSVLVGKAA